jgi:glycosyltransferase involved in cell wall biosynthesis
MIQGTRLERKFIWAGARRDVEVWYPAMDVKVISSLARSEGTTTTAMEAMSCGVPVVATDVGAIREVVDDGRTGLLVDPEDSLSLARACIAVVTNREMARGLAEAGRSAAVERFDVSVCARTHQEAFIAAIEHAGTRSGSRPS